MRSARILALIAVVFAAADARAEPAVEGVRAGLHPGKTRLVLDLSGPMEFNVFTLPDPYRVVVDLPEVAWRVGPEAMTTRIGVISSLRYGLFQPGNSRLVLDATGPVEVKQATLLGPRGRAGHRFVIDLAPTDRASFLADLKRPTARAAPAPTRNGTPLTEPPRRADGRRVVVVDAGHGGVDPGATGVSGMHEKDLVLQYAKELKSRLERTGRYHVVMTRDRDVFLPLRQRVETAQAAGGELFISIHADSIGNRRVQGGAVYTLSENASDSEAAALATKENKSDLIAGLTLDGHDDEVVSILIDLAQRETMNYAVRFANVLVPELKRQRVRVRRKPHRFAGFRVLKAPDVPSVLVELGYLSNPGEERRLRSAAGRAEITGALVKAIDRYFAEVRT